jgi:hypothetical protein
MFIKNSYWDQSVNKFTPSYCVPVTVPVLVDSADERLFFFIGFIRSIRHNRHDFHLFTKFRQASELLCIVILIKIITTGSKKNTQIFINMTYLGGLNVETQDLNADERNSNLDKLWALQDLLTKFRRVCLLIKHHSQIWI